MTFHILTVLMVLLTGGTHRTVELIRENPDRSANSLCHYIPLDTAYTAAPKGYKAVYISHFGRHGSRFQLEKYAEPNFSLADALKWFDMNDMLTEKGHELFLDVKAMRDSSKGRWGELTDLGRLEHRQICSRMVRHYPEAFSNAGRKDVTVYSTSSERVLDSRNNFLGTLSELAPGMEVTCHENEDRKAKEEVKGYKSDKNLMPSTKENTEYFKNLFREDINTERFEKEIFKVSPGHEVTMKMMKSLFTAARTFNCLGMEHAMDKYLTPEELHYLWGRGSIYWQGFMVMYGEKNPYAVPMGTGILANIIEDADKALAKKSTQAATLRFSHDTFFYPLVSTMRLEGAWWEGPSKDAWEHIIDFENVCAACNIQLVFCQNKSGKTLVKILKNEKEIKVVGLEPAKGMYYDWKALRTFWQKCIAEAE